MNEEIIAKIAGNLNVKTKQVQSVLELLEGGNTIPFIARYRKEATGALDEEQIRSINEVYEYQVNLLKRKEDVIRLIDEKGMLTEELEKEIMNASKLVEVEDLYRPFKEKKKTKATEAIKLGLQPLADKILEFPMQGSLEELSKEFITDKVKTTADAIAGAKYIIAENISDNSRFRGWIRKYTYNFGKLISKKKKNAEDENHVYDMYYEYSEQVKQVKSHRILALNRGEKEGVLSVAISVDTGEILAHIEKFSIKNKSSFLLEKKVIISYT